MARLARWVAVAALAIAPGEALPSPGSPAGSAQHAGPPGPTGAKAGGAGRVTFRQGGKAYRLPLESASIEVSELRGRRQYHASLVYRDAKNRTFAIALVLTGPGPVPDRFVSDLTVSTPVGFSRFLPGTSTCSLAIASLDPSRLEGSGSCRGLTDFGGERRSPDVTQMQFAASR